MCYKASENAHFSLDDVGVYLRDPVDSVRAHDAQVSHVHPLAAVLLDQRHLLNLLHVFRIQSCDSLQTQRKKDTTSGDSYIIEEVSPQLACYLLFLIANIKTLFISL